MTTENSGPQPKNPTSRTARRRPAAEARAAAESGDRAGANLVSALTDVAHAAIGFGLIGWNKAQVGRRALVKDLNVQRRQVETQLDGAREQLATAIRTFDAKVQPVRQDIDGQLDKFSERLPEQVRDVMAAARKVLRDTEHQVRQAVGAQ
jgi:uncharacterized protein HemX